MDEKKNEQSKWLTTMANGGKEADDYTQWMKKRMNSQND